MCEPNVKGIIESHSKFKEWETKHDVKSLLEELEEMVFMHKGAHQKFWAMQMSLRRFMSINQGPNESNDFYHYRFMGYSKAIIKQWGSFYPKELVKGTSETENQAQEKMLAMIFLGGVDKKRYGSMLASLNNSFLAGDDKYPASVNDALNTLQLWQNYGQGSSSSGAIDSDRIRPGSETSFAQRRARRNTPLDRVECWNCGELGHMQNNCPRNRNGSSNTQRRGGGFGTGPGWAAQDSDSEHDPYGSD